LDLKNGVIHEFNLTVEHEFHQVGFRVSYIGARDHGLVYFLNLDKPMPSLIPFSPDRLPYPQFTSASTLRHNGQTK
jgi:hypothetical protein